jgi:tripartite-type tricarboxylate transporter receptor subunit TctC
MQMTRCLITLGAALALALPAAAQDWPAKPIRVIVPYAPGGTDQQIRAMAPTLQKILGQPLVIENKAGGGAAIGAAFVRVGPRRLHRAVHRQRAITVVTHMRKQAPRSTISCRSAA